MEGLLCMQQEGAKLEARPPDDLVAAEFSYFTHGGPAPIGEDIAELERTRTQMAETYSADLDVLAFPWLFPFGIGGCPELKGWDWQRFFRERLLGCRRFQANGQYLFWMLEVWLRRSITAALVLVCERPRIH
eukprot:3249108-Amphidinium_carterae.1